MQVSASAQGYPWQYPFSELFAQVSSSGVITEFDRHNLKNFLLTTDLSEEARMAVDRLLQGIRRGRIRLSE
jgi:hypothetical protein